MSHLWCCLIVGCLLVVVLLYGLLELHYFLRMCLCVILARFVKRKCHILDSTTVTGLCLSNDVDTLLMHMNNARYFRELDFARVDFYERTNLYRKIISKGGSVFQGAATIRYRKFIRPFHAYQIISRIIYWDSQSIFMEHRFIRPSDKFIHSIAICRQRFVNCSADEIIGELLAPKNLQLQVSNNSVCPTTNTTTTTTTVATNSTNANANATTTTITTNNLDQLENGQMHMKMKPEAPDDLIKWIEYNELSSNNLRKSCAT